jgi:type IX secretion system PorP/SprF family membrane protein
MPGMMHIRPSIKPLFGLAGLFCSALFVPQRACAQQDPMYTMYMWNTSSVNPGYAGSADLFTVTGLMRQQWVGLDGAPNTQTLTAHTPLKEPSLGVGLSVVHDQVGPVNNTLIFADVAYRMQVTESARLAFGLKAGIDMFQADLTGLQNVDANDQLFQQNVSSSTKPNFGFGLYYWSRKGYLGLSAPKLIEHDRLSVDGTAGTVDAVQQRRHYFLIAGYVFTLSRDVKLRPSTLIKVVEGAPLQIDLSALFLLREKLWLGAAYRSGDSMDAIIAYQITDQLKAGYAYDLGLSELKGHHGGSHELMLSYDLRFNQEKTLSPRYF